MDRSSSDHWLRYCEQDCMTEPVRKLEVDGVYTRCVWCNGENYASNVIPYSKAESGCHQCGKLLPKDYIKL